MNKVSHVVILLASAAVGAQAQGICSCSPTIFNFVLDLNNYDCEVNTIKGNPGVLTAMCFQEFVDAVPGQPASDEILRRLLRDSEHDEENEPRRSLQITENIEEVVSAQFLEFGIDGDMTVINQDNTYLTTSLMDGGAMQFYSVSSDLDTSIPLEDQLEDPALVPGGASLIMYAKTGSGKVVRNRFFWLYEMTNCGRDNNPVQVGNQIGWVKVEPDLGGAWPAFCPALPDGSPTIPPKSDEPTFTPSSAPSETVIPTITPTAAPVTAAPVTAAPVTAAPVTAAPVTAAPTDKPTEAPTGTPTETPTDSPQQSSLIPGPSPTRKPTRPVFSYGSKSTKPKTLKPPKNSSKSSKSKSGKSKSKSSKSDGRRGYLNAHVIYEDFQMRSSSSMVSSFGISLMTTTLAVTFGLWL